MPSESQDLLLTVTERCNRAHSWEKENYIIVLRPNKESRKRGIFTLSKSRQKKSWGKREETEILRTRPWLINWLAFITIFEKAVLPALFPIIQFYLVLKSLVWFNFPVRTCFLITTSTLVCNYYFVLLPSSCKDFSVLDKHQLRCSVWVSLVVQAPIKKQSLVWKWGVWKSTRRKSQDDKNLCFVPIRP